MVTLFTTALLLLASFDIALCQRKVSRNVVVGGSEVKTVANFNCPEEFGYYPHPSDCTQYYVCVFGGALLESCTGGLMYSHELQTCDWPRNVGCDGAELASPATSASPPSRSREESRTRYTPPTPPPPQPAAIVTSRGQPRQLHHSQQEIIKQRQQQQLYADAEETLPPAEEVESDRQQRVYRGQPSTLGQVQKDRDGLRHSNAITNYSGRNERIGVISFGTQQQPQQQQYSKLNDILTNDLTVKRRRKRQTQRSRIRSVETWRAAQQNVKTSRLNSYMLQPPPVQTPIYSPSFQRNNFVPSPLRDAEFKPFVPSYHRVPTHTIAKKEPFTTDLKPSIGIDYFTSVTTFRPPASNKFQQPLDYNKNENSGMLPQYTHVVNHNTPAVQISNPNINLFVGTTTVPIHNETVKDEESVDYRSEYPEFNEYFGPPPSYFNTKNKYENVVNPFANPEFDFDKFLSNLREDPFEPKSKTKPAFKTNPEIVIPIKPKPTTIRKNTTPAGSDDGRKVQPKSTLTPPRKSKPKNRNPTRTTDVKPKTVILSENVQSNKYNYENAPDKEAVRASTKPKPKNQSPTRVTRLKPKASVSSQNIRVKNDGYENDSRPTPRAKQSKTTVLPENIRLNKYTYKDDEDAPSTGSVLRPSTKYKPETLSVVSLQPKTTGAPKSIRLNKYDYEDDEDFVFTSRPLTRSKSTNLEPVKASDLKTKTTILPQTVLLNKYNYEDDEDAPITESVLKHSSKSKAKNPNLTGVPQPKTTVELNAYDYEKDDNPRPTQRPSTKSKPKNFSTDSTVRFKAKPTMPTESIRINKHVGQNVEERTQTKSSGRASTKSKPKSVTPVREFESEIKTTENVQSNDYRNENNEGGKPNVISEPMSSVTTEPIRPSEYYYDDERYETKEAPKKVYSSQIKPTIKADDEYYYEEEYDYPEKNVDKPRNITKNGEIKYSAKYQEHLSKLVKTTSPQNPFDYTTTAPRLKPEKFLTAETFIPHATSTTQKPNFTTLQRTTVTVPTTRPSRTKQRLRLDDDLPYRVEQSSAAPVSTATATARALYNSSQYNSNNYDPYYALYDDDVELYRDVDYSQQYNNNNNNNAAQSQTAQQSYRRTPTPVIQSTQEESPKRGSAAFIQSNYNSQDIYQPAAGSDYSEDNSYSSQVDDQYRQLNRQPVRGDRNDLNYLEEPTTKRVTTTTSRKTTTRTTSRTFPPKKSSLPRLPVTANETKTQAQSIINTLGENPGPDPLAARTTVPTHNSSLGLDEITTYQPKFSNTSSKALFEAVVHKPSPFTLSERLTTEKPIVFHYITKLSRSTTLVSTELPKTSAADESFIKKTTVIVPTTYSPPKFFLKSFLPISTVTDSTTIHYMPRTNKLESKPHKSLKSVRKLISPINVNYGLSSVTGSSFESVEKLASEDENEKHILPYPPLQSSRRKYDSTTKTTASSTSTETLPASSEPITHIVPAVKKLISDYYTDDDIKDYTESKLRHYTQPHNSSESKRFRTTIEIPPLYDLINDTDEEKPEPDQSPSYKIQPFPKPTAVKTKTTTTDSPHNTSLPIRASRVNAAIKSQTAFGGTRRQNLKCHESAESKCNDPKRQRTSTRGRGSTHYSSGGNIINNEVTVPVNRGTPASRPRPTLKPSTSIVSKASEFVDIYRYPPTRPQPIYPQPQPDKTAAKCRKDVCLLPDCYCGGKEIPGDLPVEQVPQIVLLTFDDSVNDLNKGLYSDLFEKDRVNPNGCPISATFYVSHEWTDYSQVQNLYSDGHEIASHTVSHSFGEQFSQKKWTREVAGQREILAAYGGVHLEDVRGMRAPFLSVGGNKMFKMLYDSNFTYDSSMPIYENKPPSWPYTLDYKLFHDCMIPPCPTRSYPGVWEVPMVMWQDLNGGRCSMGDACSNPPDAEGVFKMLTKNFQRHYTTNRAPFGLFYHAAWFTQPHHKEGFINFLDSILQMKNVWLLTNWQAIQWIRDPTPTSRLASFQPFQCNYANRPKRCNNPKVCNLWHKSGVRYMRTCQPCPDIYPWTGNSGIRSSRIDNDIED